MDERTDEPPEGGADRTTRGDAERARVRRRNRLKLLAVPLVLLVIGGYVGDALLPKLVDANPTALIFLNPRTRNLVLVSNELGAATFYAVASFRLLLTDPIWYFLGREYGDDAIIWLEHRSASYGRMARTAERWFGKAAYALVVLAPNNWICLLSGAARMRVGVFLALNLVGTFGRLYLIRVLGDLFSGPLDVLLDFIRRNQWQLMIVSIGLVALSLWNERRQGGGEIEAITHLDEELIDGHEEPDGEPGPGGGHR